VITAEPLSAPIGTLPVSQITTIYQSITSMPFGGPSLTLIYQHCNGLPIRRWKSTRRPPISPNSAGEHETALGEINISINQMSQLTQKNAAMAEEATAAKRSLSMESEKFSGLVRQFEVGTTHGEEAMRRELKRAAPHVFRSPCLPVKSERRLGQGARNRQPSSPAGNAKRRRTA